jgi:hypothetical protein
VQCRGVDDHLGESRSCWGIVASPVLVLERLRGWWCRGCSSGRRPWALLEGTVDGRPYEAQWRVWRRPVPVRLNSVRDVVAVPGVALQWRGWPHRADSDGEDLSRQPDVTM